MARTKKSGGKKKKSDGVKRVTTLKPRALNPFEVHVNRQKFEVLGRKLKNDKGLPGVSRAKALKKVLFLKITPLAEINQANCFLEKSNIAPRV